MFLVSSDTGRAYVNLFAKGDPEFAPTYLTDHAADDFRVARVLARPPGVFAPERAYVSDSDARQSRIHQELLPRFGIYDISGANLSFGSCIGWFGIARPRPGDGIDGASSQLLSALSPHLLRAFRLVQRQADLDLPAPSANVADLRATAVFVFEAEQLVRLNSAAERVLADGWVSLRRGGQLTCSDRKNSALLAAFYADRRAEALPLHDPDTGTVHMLRRMEGAWPRQQRQVLALTQLTPPPPQFDEMEAFCEPFGLSPDRHSSPVARSWQRRDGRNLRSGRYVGRSGWRSGGSA